MKRSLLYCAAALALTLASCSTASFMTRKYMPGHFFNGSSAHDPSGSASAVVKTEVKPEITDQQKQEGLLPVNEQPAPVILSSKMPSGNTVVNKESLRHTLSVDSKIVNDEPVSLRPVDKKESTVKMRDRKNKITAWLSLIFGLLTFYGIIFSSLTAALLAIIFAFITFHRIRKDSSEYGGKFLAFLGMLLGLIGVTLMATGKIKQVTD